MSALADAGRHPEWSIAAAVCSAAQVSPAIQKQIGQTGIPVFTVQRVRTGHAFARCICDQAAKRQG